MAKRIKFVPNAKFKRDAGKPCRITFGDDKEPDGFGRRRFVLEWIGWRHVRQDSFRSVRAQMFFARPEDHVVVDEEVERGEASEEEG